VNGAEIWDCEGFKGTENEELPQEPFQLQRGADAPLWQIVDACIFRLDVSGNTATYRAGPTCTFAEGSISYQFTPKGGTLLVNGDQMLVSARFDYVEREPSATLTCKLQHEGRAQRIPR
jgi:hypothetical protein